MIDETPRRWLVTGVSSGLGRTLVQALARRGHAVVGTVRRAGSEGDLADLPGVHIVRLDVTDPASVASGMAEAVALLGGLDVLVNNAGSGMFGPVEVCSDEDFRACMEVNYFGLLRVTRAGLPHLRASRGVLINFGSISSFITLGGTAPYAAAKHAVLGASESLHDELRHVGVKVIVPMPGGFRTDFWTEQNNTIREGLQEVYGPYPCGNIREQSSHHVGHEVGDPVKFADALIDVAASDDPPLHFVLSRDALDYVGGKLERMVAELQSTRAIDEAIAFDTPVPA